MTWRIEFHPEAVDELEKVDQSIRQQIIRAIKNKLGKDPKGYGDPLGSKGSFNLTNLYSLRVAKRGMRVIYYVRDLQTFVLVVAIGKREDFQVHRTAHARIKYWVDETEAELQKIERITGESAG